MEEKLSSFHFRRGEVILTEVMMFLTKSSNKSLQKNMSAHAYRVLCLTCSFEGK